MTGVSILMGKMLRVNGGHTQVSRKICRCVASCYIRRMHILKFWAWKWRPQPAESSLCNESWQKRRDRLLLHLILQVFQSGTGRLLHNHHQGDSETRTTISSLFTSWTIFNAFCQDSIVGIKWLKASFCYQGDFKTKRRSNSLILKAKRKKKESNMMLFLEHAIAFLSMMLFCTHALLCLILPRLTT